jgi:hypothetical protein
MAVSGRWSVTAGLALVIITGAGCTGSALGRVAHTPTRSAVSARGNACRSAPNAHRRQSSPWPSRSVVDEGVAERIADQVLDSAAGAVFLLVSKTNAPVRGPWALCGISLATGAVRQGPTFSVGSIAIASGHLWVYGAPGTGTSQVITEINPLTLRRVRSISVPSGSVAVTAGPAGSVWIGSNRMLLRVSTSTGATLTRVTLPSGLAADDVSVNPGHATLYVSAAHVVHGGMSGLVMLEYDARTGRKLAAANGGLISDSVMGATLTPVSAGIWASFRTGMLGLTIHLSARGLRAIAPPGPGIGLTPATGVFHWPMFETTAYGGGALWVANQIGIVACLDARTGKIRASERVPQPQLIYSIEAIDPTARVIYALDDRGLLRINPPRECWN